MITIKKMFEHLNWANYQLLDTLQTENVVNEKIRSVFSHILLTENIWLMKLKQEKSTKEQFWDTLSWEECINLIQENEQGFQTIIENEDLEQTITYIGKDGNEYTPSIQEVLTHIALHGQHHRGQINLLLRTQGIEPVNMDFILFVR